YFLSLSYRNDAELVKEIVNVVLKRLVKSPNISKGLVGIDEKIAIVESWIRKEPNDTRLIGIWGMGGVGKTTLAEEIFNKLQSEYDGCYFLAHEREESNKHGIVSLKENFFSGLLGYDVKIYTPNLLPEDIVRRIGCMKVLIVLDDVKDSNHIQKLLGTPDNFRSGSRIIVTTRDEQVLKANKVDKTYQLRELSSDEALELFNLNAFKQSDNQREYNELSKRVVNYAQGIPLVVKVLAGLLCGKNKEEWESMLDKLKKSPPTEVYEVMKLSYDGLDHKEQQIFLDLACFLLRTHIVHMDDLKCLLKDNESDNSVAFRLGRLKDKALITFSEDNIVCMHDSLQEMAWEIVRQESIEDPGSRSRLWDPDDIYDALKNNKVTEAIRSIRIDLPTIKEQKLMPQIFAKMRKIRFLEISGEDNYDCYDQLILAERLQFLTTELRFLCWENYPLKSLPLNFSAEKLVILKLRRGRMEKLWDGVKNLVNLKEVVLVNSKIKELPDLSKATNLKVLDLFGCLMLTSVHPSIFSLPKLEKVELCYCSLSYLNLHFCENLPEFSLISENMEGPRLHDTKAVPSSFGHESKLKSLILRGSHIERLPSSFNHLTELVYLDLSICNKLQTIAVLPLSLETLDIKHCGSLQSLPELPPLLETLDAAYCRSLQSLPELPLFLKTLYAHNCEPLQSLPELPLFLKSLGVNSCISLQSLPELPPFLKSIDVSCCKSLQSLPELPLSLETLYATFCGSLQSLPKLSPSLETLDLKHCESLESLPELPPSLGTLNVRGCISLKTVLFPSTTAEQLKENKKRVLFLNCLNLDEHSLVAIGLNAQINMMKLAYQHLSTPNHHHVRSYNNDDSDYDSDDYGYLENHFNNHHSYQGVYGYPGSSVPEWLECKTTKDYIVIDLSSAQACPLLGFIFCFVIGKYRDTIGKLECYINVSEGDGNGEGEGEGEGEKDSVRMYINYWVWTIESDHVCVIYDRRCSDFLNSRAKNQTRFKIEVRMEERINKGTSEEEEETYYAVPLNVLKEFGVSRISTSTYNSFIQQMELRDSMHQFH
ncbi:Disease resistance protein RRS1, partial [Mucuna pruriens]